MKPILSSLIISLTLPAAALGQAQQPTGPAGETGRFSPAAQATAAGAELQPLTSEVQAEVSAFFNPQSPEELARSLGVGPPATSRTFETGFVIAEEQRGRLRPAPEELVRRLPALHGPNLRYFIIDGHVVALDRRNYTITDSIRLAPVGRPVPLDVNDVPAKPVGFSPAVATAVTDFFATQQRGPFGLSRSLAGQVRMDEVPREWLVGPTEAGYVVDAPQRGLLAPAPPELASVLPQLRDPAEEYFLMGANLVIINTRNHTVVESIHIPTIRAER